MGCVTLLIILTSWHGISVPPQFHASSVQCSYAYHQLLTRGVAQHGAWCHVCLPGASSWHHRFPSQAAGTIQSAEGFTFLRVFDAGHMVPRDQPEAALTMLNQFISNKLK